MKGCEIRDNLCLSHDVDSKQEVDIIVVIIVIIVTQEVDITELQVLVIHCSELACFL